MATLTLKRQSFAREFAISGNGTQSAVAAGYSERSAHVTASRLLRVANVAAAIEAERGRLRERSDLRTDDVIRGLRQIAEDDSAKNSDRIRAYELLGKHLRLFVDRVETMHSVDVPELKTYSLRELHELRDLMVDSGSAREPASQPAIEVEARVLDD